MISQFKRLLRPRAEGTATTVAEAGAERDRTSGHGDGEQPSGSAAGAESRGTFSALRYRNFRLFFFGQLISLTGTWMDITAEGWLVYKLTGSKLLLGVVGVAGSAPLLLFSIWGGWLADHYPKRTVIVLTQSVSMVLAFILSAIVWLGVVRPWHIVLIAFLFGVVLAFDMPSRQSFFIEMTSRDELANAISLNSSIVNGARIVGPAMAGAVMAQSGIAFCFFLNGLSFIAVIAVLLMMRLPAHVWPAQKESAWKQALSGFHYLRGDFVAFSFCGRWSLRMVLRRRHARFCAGHPAR
jgi:MFS family permease